VGWFYAYLMGWSNIKNYDGSFFEWSTTSPNAVNHPIATGVPSYAPYVP
jgi:3-mercaptopyruvate sulfurtransferase SseA